ncbi:MAG: hypothetical protein U0527_06515 [Candidatus Eisenbacteria bacterium]
MPRSVTARRGPTRLSWLGSILALLACGLLGAASAEEIAPSDTSHVAYVSGRLVYVAAGRARGLRDGDRLSVWRGRKEVGAISVEHLSSTRAACAPLDTSFVARAGDLVRFAPHGAETIAAPITVATMNSGPARPPRSRGWMRDHGIRGRVGLRLLAGLSGGGSALGYRQPACDVRLDGTNVGGQPIDLAVDARARRTWYDSGTPGRDATKVYRLAVARRSGPYRLAVGRQTNSAIGAIGTFDGLTLERRAPRWSIGLLGGAQPEPLRYGLSSDIVEGGLYLQREAGSFSTLRSGATVGVVGSYRGGKIDREFMALLWRLDSPRGSFFLSQEVDLNRGWKRGAGEPALSLTSTYAQARRQLGTLSGSIGYDNRRSVRLYRDRVTPETEFDDRYRAGGSIGLAWEPRSSLRLNAESRTSRAGGEQAADAHTLGISLTRLTGIHLSTRARSTLYTNAQSTGLMHAINLSLPVARACNLDLEVGTRSEEARHPGYQDSRRDWAGLDLDVSVSRSLYLLLSEDREVGDGVRTDRIHAALSYRF